MNILAVRDDGALLVTGGGEAAIIVSDEGLFTTTRGAALARGTWGDVTTEVVPLEVRDRVRRQLDELDTELDTIPKPMLG